MKFMVAFIAVAMLAMLTEGCARTADDGQTVGQKLDRVFDRTNLALAEAGASLTDSVDAPRSLIDTVADSVSERALLSTLAVADAGISASIKSELARDPALNALNIGVEAHDGVVSLNGRADDASHRERAEQLARANRQVIRVDNYLTVSSL
jgi:hypothetical protein